MEKPCRYDPLSEKYNFIPPNLSRIYLMGICGTAMASLAGALKALCFEVAGSDRTAYPPMSTFLQQLEIPVHLGFTPHNLQSNPHLVVVGNVITRNNPEIAELARLQIPFCSLPQALNHFAIKDKNRIVIAGTHGKTTTSSLIAWCLETAGLDPGFMIGGIPLNFGKGFKLGSGRYFVVEGDEYDTAFFDKGPKFFHYDPTILILSSIEFDHADIYENLEQITENFRQLISHVPRHGHIVANSDDGLVLELCGTSACPVHYYGNTGPSEWKIEETVKERDFTSILVTTAAGKKERFTTSLYGRHNMSNILAAIVAAHILGLSPKIIRRAIRTFRGVKRRQEKLGEFSDVILLDDFAHHPTAVRETTSAVKGAYPNRRLVAVFEPRSNSSRRNIFQKDYAESFGDADLVFVPEPTRLSGIEAEHRFSSHRLVEDLKAQGIEAYDASTTDELLPLLIEKIRPGDVVIFMSNGDFNNLPDKFLKALQGLKL